MSFMKKGSPLPLKGKGSKLTPMQEIFLQEYMVDYNASRAILKAGYKTKNPNRLGTDLLNHPLIQKELSERTKERRERMELTVDYVVNKLVSIVEETEAGNPNAALRGLELLAKHLGMLKEKTEISGPNGGAIEYEQKVKEDAANLESAIARLAERGGKTGLAIVPNTGTEG